MAMATSGAAAAQGGIRSSSSSIRLRGMLLVAVVLALGAVNTAPAVAAGQPRSLALTRGSMMYLDADTGSLFVGDRDALMRVNGTTLGVVTARNITDPDNCIPYDAVAFSMYDGAGYDDPEFCTASSSGQTCLQECDGSSDPCRLRFFSSTCNGNQYFVMQRHEVTGDLLVCSALTQCQTIDAASLASLNRGDTAVDEAPQGWFCNFPEQKFIAQLQPSTVKTNTQQYCPVWRYGPIDIDTFQYPQRVAAKFVPDLGDVNETPVLFLGTLAEEARDHAFQSTSFPASNILAQVTKRDTTTYTRVCASSPCSSNDDYAVVPDASISETVAETQRVRHEFLAIEYDDDFVYVVMNWEAEGPDPQRPIAARFCRSPGTRADNGVIRTEITCGSEVLNIMHREQVGERLWPSWGEDEALIAVSDSNLCLFSLSGTPQYASLSLRVSMDAFMTGTYGTASCNDDLVASSAVVGSIGGSSTFAPITGAGALTALAVDVVHGHTVAFVGTDAGAVLRVHLQQVLSPAAATTYGVVNTTNVVVTSSQEAVVQLQMWSNASTLFVLSESSVVSLPAHTCGQYTTCGACVTSMDPYCGWCPLSNTCTERSACALPESLDRAANTTDTSSSYWLHGFDGATQASCPALTTVLPTEVPVNTNTTVTFTVSSLPPLLPGERWYCDVASYGSFAAEASGPLVTCNVNIGSLAAGVTGYVHATTISLAHGPSGITVADDADAVTPLRFDNRVNVSFPLEVYDCGVRTPQGCSGCPARCGWCAYDNTCTSGPSFCRDNDASAWLNTTAAAAECPQVNTTSPGAVHARLSNETLHWSGKNFVQPVQGTDTYTCVFTDSAGLSVTETTGAFVNATRVSCPVPNESGQGLTGGTRTRTATLRFRGWPVGDAPTASIAFYDCNVLGGGNTDQDCGRCLSVSNPLFACGWCQRASVLQAQCTYVSECAASDATFLPAQGGDVSACPQPAVLSVAPSVLPTTGGTVVTIVGRNLGRALADIASVSIAGTACTLTDFDVASGTLMCRTPSFATPAANVAVNVLLGGGQMASSTATISVVEPRVSGIDPAVGIRAGGAVVTLTGAGLDAGQRVNVTLAETACELFERTATQMRCELQPTPDTTLRRRRRRGSDLRAGGVVVGGRFARALPTSVCVQMDGQLESSTCSRVSAGIEFEVRDDPTIAMTWPATAPANASFNFVVLGTNLDAAQTLTLRLYSTAVPAQDLATVSCTAINTTAAACPISTIPHVVAAVPSLGTAGLPTSYDLFADAANYTGNAVVFALNPVVSALQPETAGPGDIMVLSGERLTAYGSFAVYVAGVPAVIQLESDTQVTVRVPDVDVAPNVPLDVTYALLDYAYNTTLSGSFQLQAQASGTDVAPIAGSIVGAFCVALVVLALVYRRNIRTRRTKEKALLRQMQDLETQVIDVARQGFTELQEGGQLALTLSEAHPRPFGEYARRVYFTALDTHPLPVRPRFPGTNDCIEQFTFFLQQDDFLRAFVGVMEGEGRAFSVRDRCQVASLLMCSANGDEAMGTHTLSTLLDQYFTANSRRDPRLMLRRTESVAEKLLTAWLTTGMHDAVLRDAARPLYNLTQALKIYAWKGPVDAVTGAATYTLNADALLRERVEYEPLTLHVDMNRQVYEVHVNSCDTIGQILEKLKLVVTTAGADVSDFDTRVLVLQREEGLRVLKDIDDSSKMSAGWVQLNTASFYGMRDGDQLAFVKSDTDGGDARRRRNNNSSSSGGGGGGGGGGSLFKVRTKSKSRIDPMACEPWHLVKPDTDGTAAAAAAAATRVPSEIFLTYLMTVKTALQPFVDDLVDAVFNIDQPSPAVRFLFHFLDDQARKHNISDPRTTHIWKSNAFPLRFWINLIKNPDFLLHVQQTRTVSSGLSTVAQVIMDSCSVSDQQLGKHSPANKHLYRKEVAEYKQKIANFYTAISRLPPPTDAELQASFASAQSGEQACDRPDAVCGLMEYALRFREQLLEELVAVGHKPMADDVARVLGMFAHRGSIVASEEDETSSYLNIVAGDDSGPNRNSACIDEEMFSLGVLMEDDEEESEVVRDGDGNGLADSSDTAPMVSNFF
nr:plexin 1 [Salpingoeca rosetta]